MGKKIDFGRIDLDEASAALVDSDEFTVLEPTQEGLALINRFVISKRKKESEKKTVKDSNDWDLSVLDQDLIWATRKLERGQFKKIQSGFAHKRMLETYMSHVIDSGEIPDGDSHDLELSIVDRIINIGKTFFENSDVDNFIGDQTYDGLLSVLKKYKTEPVGVTPDTGKTEITDAEYSTLAINMDKCYILHPNDTLPEGVKETDSVEAWLKRCYKALGLNHADELSIVAMPKLDGVALRGEVDTNNCLNNPLLRGDEKKSILVKGLNHIRLTDEKPISDTPFGCQFEVFVTYEDAEKASQYLKLEKPYVSPRHAASGMINRLCVNPDDNLVPFLSFYPINTEDLEGTYVDRLNLIDRFGNVDVVKTRVYKGTLDLLLTKIERRFRKLNNERNELPYAIDGLVLSIADDAQQETIGRSGRTNKWQIAWKFDPASTVGEVKGIELSSGKKGFRTIQIVLKEPVSIDGVKYDHVPALSADIFERYNLAEGDLIRIHRVGDVIPSISIEERKGGKKIELPKKCPVCGEDMIWEAKKLKCVYPGCRANKVGSLLTFFQYADIKGFGEVEIGTLVDAGLDELKYIVDPYEDNVDDWADAGYTEEQAKELQQSIIDALRDMWDYELLGNSGIHSVGPETAKKAMYEYLDDWNRSQIFSPNDYYNAFMGSYSLHMRPREDDGMISCCWRTTSDMPNYRLWGVDAAQIMENLCNVMVRYCKESTYEHFANLKSVGHTGGMPSKETQKFIRKLGWELVDGKKFDYLIVPSYGHESTKTKVAKEKGIEMFTEEDFVEEFSGNL